MQEIDTISERLLEEEIDYEILVRTQNKIKDDLCHSLSEWLKRLSMEEREWQVEQRSKTCWCCGLPRYTCDTIPFSRISNEIMEYHACVVACQTKFDDGWSEEEFKKDLMTVEGDGPLDLVPDSPQSSVLQGDSTKSRVE